MPKKIMIVAGEMSGDLYGSLLAGELKKQEGALELFGIGGDKMRSAGVDIVADSVQFASMGFVDVLQNFHRYIWLYRFALSTFQIRQPDVVVLIDFPEFNLRFGKRIKKQCPNVVYYVSPQVWAWRAGRIKDIAKIAKKMLVLFEFEVKIYEDAGIDVQWVGHPILDILSEPTEFDGLRSQLAIGKDDLVIGLLPGSRNKEFKRLFPIMTNAARLLLNKFPKARFLVGCAPNIKSAMVETEMKKMGPPLPCNVLWNKTYEVIRASDIVIAASGTVTLECAILETPMIVTYKVNPITFLLFLPFLKGISNFAMVNIVGGRRIMPEYYQHLAKPKLLAGAITSIIKEGKLKTMKNDLLAVKAKLGGPGASFRAAKSILQLLW